MNPASLEKLSALSLLLLGIAFLLFALTLMGFKVPFLGPSMLAASVVAIITGIFLFLDSMKQ
ncbi:MAG: hypothetical protein HY368_00780 [Candidatus Aenigmarchaeota archaeon]|nr:hypothetical protein [Candidatus Aenigmarchaeota archaeon]